MRRSRKLALSSTLIARSALAIGIEVPNADAIGSPAAGGHARAELAALLARRGDRRRAAAVLGQARGRRTDGLRWLERRIDGVAAQLAGTG